MRPAPVTTAIVTTSIVTIGIVLAGCFTTASDFSDDAEEFLVSDADLHAQLGVEGFSNAVCDDPESQTPGTTFRCTATDDAGQAWEFRAEIIDGDDYRLEVRRAP